MVWAIAKDISKDIEKNIAKDIEKDIAEDIDIYQSFAKTVTIASK